MYNLSALKQGSRTINELLATFNCYLMEASQQNQPDNMKIFWHLLVLCVAFGGWKLSMCVRAGGEVGIISSDGFDESPQWSEVVGYQTTHFDC